MSESQFAPDPVLLDARDRARAALAEITDAATIGVDDGHEVEGEHVLTLFFECRLTGYPGWRWAATLARTSEDAPVTVLEVELLPGPGAVVAPEWVPWSERLAQYRESQSKQGADDASRESSGADDTDDSDEAEDDVLDNDFSDFDAEIDGVDLDEDAAAFDEGDDDDDADEDRDDDADDTDLFDDDSDDVDDDDSDDESDDDDDDDDEDVDDEE